MEKVINSNILGTDYSIHIGDRKDLDIREENMGECRVYSKDIYIVSEIDECTKSENRLRVQEITAHEIFHAYMNEAGVEISESAEEAVATFFMKNWRKMNNSILEVLDKSDFLDK